MKIPDKIESAPTTFSDYVKALNQLIEWAEKVERIEGKNGIQFTATEHNIVISQKFEEVEGEEETHPFKVTDATDLMGAKVYVKFGQVNSVTPTISGTDLDDSSPPALTITVSGVVYLEVTVNNNGAVTAVEVKNASSLPTATSTKGYLTLATVTKTGSTITAINQSVTHSLQHYKCGSTTHRFKGI